MKDEPEAILKKYGCPYKLEDPRAADWLDGYSKGYTDGSNMGINALERIAGTK